MSLTVEDYQKRMSDAIAILTVPNEKDLILQRQIDLCNKWLETDDGKDMISKITPYLGSILEFISKQQG